MHRLPCLLPRFPNGKATLFFLLAKLKSLLSLSVSVHYNPTHPPLHSYDYHSTTSSTTITIHTHPHNSTTITYLTPPPHPFFCTFLSFAQSDNSATASCLSLFSSTPLTSHFLTLTSSDSPLLSFLTHLQTHIAPPITTTNNAQQQYKHTSLQMDPQEKLEVCQSPIVPSTGKHTLFAS